MKNVLNTFIFIICFSVAAMSQSARPNILFCIADDASWEHMSANRQGNEDWVRTPGFDYVAAHGILFTSAYTPTAKCAPSRSTILTGRNPWLLEEAANHAPYFPAKFTSFFEAFDHAGYATGFTGKGWAPGKALTAAGKPRQLTGPDFSARKLKAAASGMAPNDYTANFADFLNTRQAGQPFCFWYGSKEPHRAYEYASGVRKAHKDPKAIRNIPPFWPDTDSVRNDMLDYAYEVEHFDEHVSKMIALLDSLHELDNTIIIVTSDNGMPFPRVKGHLYMYDNHLPLAIMWNQGIANKSKTIRDFVSFVDFAPTLMEAARITPDSSFQTMTGRSLCGYFSSAYRFRPAPDHMLLGREREDVGRPDDQGYPVRAIIKGDYMLSVNYEHDRWPSGDPVTGYLDTDPSPTKTQILSENRRGVAHDHWVLCFGKTPELQLFQLSKDPWCIHNLAADPRYLKLCKDMRAAMEAELKAQGDPRMWGKGQLFDAYPYAEDNVRDLYNRLMRGEAIRSDWLRAADREAKDFDPEHPVR